MTRPVDLSAATTAALTLKARYEIEAGFDYLYVQASTDGGTTWTSLDGTAGGSGSAPASWPDGTTARRVARVGNRPGRHNRPTPVVEGGIGMRVLFGSALVVALGAAACGGGDGNRTGTGSSHTRSGSDEPPDPDASSTSTTPPAGADDASTSITPPATEAEPPLRRPKPSVPLSVTPPPIKPPSGPTDRLKPVTVTGTLAEPVPGCIVVEADNGRWELAGTLPERLDVGERVVVTGRPAPEVEGACGAPVIRVREVGPA
jgi:Immune inhibitor A peptidase M6